MFSIVISQAFPLSPSLSIHSIDDTTTRILHRSLSTASTDSKHDSFLVDDDSSSCWDPVVERPQKVKKSVSFKSTASVKSTKSWRNFSCEEIVSSWYKAEEYHKIRKSCAQQVRRLDLGKTLKDKKYCARGLESHTAAGSKLKKQIRQDCYNAVLCNQWEADEETIAKKYRDIASTAVLRAIAIGRADEIVVTDDSR